LFQIECHPYLNQTKLIAFCKEKGITITAYSPFAGPTSIAPLHKGETPEPLKDPKIKELAAKYGKSVAQIILRYLVSFRLVPKGNFVIYGRSFHKYLPEGLEDFMKLYHNSLICT
jgi:aldehyde reductase